MAKKKEKSWKAFPSGYNEVRVVKGEQKVRTKCKCGWATPWRGCTGRPPKGAIFFHDFLCPNCEAKLAEATWVPNYGR